MSCVERERGLHAATACSSQTLCKPKQLHEWADLTCTVTAILLELMQGGHGNRWWERTGLSLLLAACVGWSFTLAGCCWGERVAAAACLVLDLALVWLYGNSAKKKVGSGLLHNQVCAMLVPRKGGTGSTQLFHPYIAVLKWAWVSCWGPSVHSVICSYWNSVGDLCWAVCPMPFWDIS